MIELMNVKVESSLQAVHVNALERFRTRLTTLTVLVLLMTFFFITVALWSYAAWWAPMSLIGLFG